MTAVVCNFQRKTVYYCCLQHDKFVDLLRNCCAAYDICKERGWDLSIDISLHPLANLFLCKVPSRNNVTVVRANSCEEFLNSICNTDDLQININADLYPQQNPTTECNAYIIENFLALRPEFEDFLNETLTNLSLERKNYCVVYIEQGYQSFLEKIDEKVVLVCTISFITDNISSNSFLPLKSCKGKTFSEFKQPFRTIINCFKYVCA